MASPVVLSVSRLGFPWTTSDPFLFCAHHNDAYPAGNERLGPSASLAGRRIGMDFAAKDGWSMYHGDVVPGFPRHPHRGFETVTIARRGFIDHADSLGATARFGHGDVQWMTAGGGIVHSEMFPLIERDKPNPTELFQIWLNLPRAHKLVDPYFTMLWNHTIPRQTFSDPADRVTDVAFVTGSLADANAPAPPPNSWAAATDAEVAIWTIRMSPGARWQLPAASVGLGRTLYFFSGSEVTVGERKLTAHAGVALRADTEVPLLCGHDEVELLLLQGRPIGEPVVQHGPFVMNTASEIMQAMKDYQRTQFGEWPWPSDAPVHARDRGRFAVHADGRVEKP